MLGFQNYQSAARTIPGIEIMHMIHKGQVEGIQCVISEVKMINEILGIAS